jgi:beta-galactosidase
MAHIYGHTWPIRWGAPGEQKMVKVYSNCEKAELFLNGRSLGSRSRNNQDFPAAGLRWMTPFVEGTNKLRVVAQKGSTTVTDEIEFNYQTQTWSAPAKLTLTELPREADKVTVEASLLDAQGILCLDARTRVRFSIAGSGRLIDNLGTPTGSRVVELANGKTRITVQRNGSETTMVAIQAKGVSGTVLTLA